MRVAGPAPSPYGSVACTPRARSRHIWQISPGHLTARHHTRPLLQPHPNPHGANSQLHQIAQIPPAQHHNFKALEPLSHSDELCPHGLLHRPAVQHAKQAVESKQAMGGADIKRRRQTNRNHRRCGVSALASAELPRSLPPMRDRPRRGHVQSSFAVSTVRETTSHSRLARRAERCHRYGRPIA